MRRVVLLILAALCVSPAYADGAREVTVKVAYLGQGVFSYKKDAYVYDALVTKLRDKYADKHIDWVQVDMGTVATQEDRTEVCQLRQALLVRVKMILTVGEEKRELFCN